MEAETDKIRLLEMIRSEFNFFERTLLLIAPERMLIPNVIGWWSVKDTVAHFTAWMEYLLRWFDQATHGQKPDIPAPGYTWDDIDKLNDARSERDKDLPLNQVISDFRQAHLDVCELVQALTERDLFESDWDGLFYQPPWRLISANTYQHLHEYAVPIRQWINDHAD